MKRTYWIVVYASNLVEALQKHPETIRVSWVRTTDPKIACIDTFGMHCHRMWAKPFSTLKEWRNFKTRKQLLTPEGFVKL